MFSQLQAHQILTSTLMEKNNLQKNTIQETHSIKVGRESMSEIMWYMGKNFMLKTMKMLSPK